MKNFLKYFGAPIAAALLSGVIVAWAAQTNYLGTVFIADSTVPTRQLTVNADGSINTSPASGSIAPVVSSALESNHVIKAGAGNLYDAYITTGATAGWFLVANATSAPTAGGAAIAPIACVIAPANSTISISSTGGAPIVASTGITLVFSTSGCLTNTASATAFFSGRAQ